MICVRGAFCVVRCSCSIVCCMLYVVKCSLFVVGRLLRVVVPLCCCVVLNVERCELCVVCCVVYVGCSALFGCCCVLLADTCYLCVVLMMMMTHKTLKRPIRFSVRRSDTSYAMYSMTYVQDDPDWMFVHALGAEVLSLRHKHDSDGKFKNAS